eukprot:jgi/Orpsp1_1/1182709/evm.model.c7180000082332.1
MKPLPEEIAFRIANISYNPFFYLINGVWNKKNFDILIKRNYTFPSLVRRLIRSNEKKILKQLLTEYEDVIKSFPESIQNDINNLLVFQKKENDQSSNSHRKVSETNIFIPQLKILTADDIKRNTLKDIFDNYLITGEYTYIRKESDMAGLINLVKEKYQSIKETIADSSGSIPSATEKMENSEYSFIYLYALISSLNLPLKWNQQLSLYHPYFIKIKVTEKEIEIFQWFNNAFQCQTIETIKQTYNVLKEIYHECRLRSYPSCHLFYLYDQYIEDILKFYDEDNDQIFKYYSGISSNPDETLVSLFNYTSLILLLRSPYVRCQLTDPDKEIKIKKEIANQKLRKIQPSIIHTLFNSDRKVILVTSPLYTRSFDIEHNILATPSYNSDEINELSSNPKISSSNLLDTPSSSSSLINEKEKEKEKEKYLNNVTIFIKNNLISFTSQAKEWYIKRHRSLIDANDKSLHHQKEMLYYTAAKTSKLISHSYDEDWYIHFCLYNKKHKGIAAARIYLY